jgi:hypothetical protein
MCWGHIPDEQGAGEVRRRLAQPPPNFPGSGWKRGLERRRVPRDGISVRCSIRQYQKHPKVSGIPAAVPGQQRGDKSAPAIGGREQILLIDDLALDFGDQQCREGLSPSDHVDGAALAVHGERLLE